MRRKDNAKKTPQDLLARVKHILDSNLLAHLPAESEHAVFLHEMKVELRTLQASLTNIDKADYPQLSKWSRSRNTNARLTNLETALHTLEKKRDNKNISPERIAAHIRIVKRGKQFDDDFVNYLQIDESLKRLHHKLALKKNIKEAKYFVSSTAEITSKLNSVAKTAKSVAIAAAPSADGTAHAAHSGAQAGGAVSTMIQTLPIVGAVVGVLAAAGSAGQSFMKKKGFSDRAVKVTSVIVAAAALAFTIAFPVAAIAISAGTCAFSTFSNYIKPYFDLRKEIKGKEAELEKIKERIDTYENKHAELDTDDRKFLIKDLEKHYAINDHLSLHDFSKIKQEIMSDDLETLEKNVHIREALGMSDKESLKAKLIEFDKNKLTSLTTEITKLKSEKTTMGALSIAGGFTTAGLVMMAVPFPPVILAGAVVAATSSVVGMIIHYREPIARFFNKIGHALKGLFTRDKPEETLRNDLKNDKVIEPSVVPVKQAEVAVSQSVRADLSSSATDMAKPAEATSSAAPRRVR